MNKPPETVAINIDNRQLVAPAGATILEAAQQNGIYIPTLCAHKDLTPFGGCRMCIVEVDQMRGFPTACTTPIEPGMVIRTCTSQLQSVRSEILRLILSEHPSSCLICDEATECKNYSLTIRKAGVTTGCRYCANDAQCELQKVVEWLGITEIGYPVYYRNLRVEKEDPFYDRDYNLCILCGRCIRVCHEVRAADTLAFKQRGRHTIIGPAFSRTHLEAGCEFCGACVEVCPTGTLSEKTRKWAGKPEREVTTTCALCGIGCQLKLQINKEEVIGAIPAEDALVNNGQLCVKGRFCIPELVNNYQRLRRAYRVENGTRVDINLDEAIELAAAKLSQCPPQRLAMVVSPTLCNEDLYVAQKFARAALRSNRLTSSAKALYGSSFYPYLSLLPASTPLESLRCSDVILCLGLDARYGRSVAGVELRKAQRRGAKIVTIHPRHHNLTMISHLWLCPDPGAELDLVRSLVDLTAANPSGSRQNGGDLAQVATLLKESSSAAIMVGSEFLWHQGARELLNAVVALAHNTRAGVVPLPLSNNLVGTVFMGASAEFLPGGISITDKTHRDHLSAKWGVSIPEDRAEWNPGGFLPADGADVLYLIGENPPDGDLSGTFVIMQNIYPAAPFKRANLALPAAAFTEVDGSFINGDGRVQRVHQAVAPPGESLPDWEMICLIARKMGVAGFEFRTPAEVFEEISGLVPGFDNFESPSRQPRSLTLDHLPETAQEPAVAKADGHSGFPLLLTTTAAEHIYRGYSLSSRVAGMRTLVPEGVVDLSAADATRAGVSTGDRIVVTSPSFERLWSVRIVDRQRDGAAHVWLAPGEAIGPNPHRVSIRRADV